MTHAEHDAVWAEVEDSFRQFVTGDGFVTPQTFLMGVGTR